LGQRSRKRGQRQKPATTTATAERPTAGEAGRRPTAEERNAAEALGSKGGETERFLFALVEPFDDRVLRCSRSKKIN